ncbi:MAG: hypothetical protein ACRD3W_01020, partial [Terriglobales bacterium]
MRIFGRTPRQIGFIYGSLLIAFLVALKFPSGTVAHLPVGFVMGVIILSVGVALAHATNIRSVGWWRNRALYAVRALPLYLPDLHVAAGCEDAVLLLPSGEKRACFRCDGIDLMHLDQAQRQDLAGVLTNIIMLSRDGFAVVSTARPDKEGARAFYGLYDPLSSADVPLIPGAENAVPSASPSIIELLRKCGLAPEIVSREEIRSLLYSQLSPSRFMRGDPV